MLPERRGTGLPVTRSTWRSGQHLPWGRDRGSFSLGPTSPWGPLLPSGLPSPLTPGELHFTLNMCSLGTLPNLSPNRDLGPFHVPCVSCLVVSNSLQPHGLRPTRLVCPWNSPGKNTGVGSHFLLQGIFLLRDWTQVSCIAGRFFTIWATSEALGNLKTRRQSIITSLCWGNGHQMAWLLPIKILGKKRGPQVQGNCG